MYEITIRTKRTGKQYAKFVDEKIQNKLKLLKQNPRKEIGAHPLKGRLKGK